MNLSIATGLRAKITIHTVWVSTHAWSDEFITTATVCGTYTSVVPGDAEAMADWHAIIWDFPTASKRLEEAKHLTLILLLVQRQLTDWTLSNALWRLVDCTRNLPQILQELTPFGHTHLESWLRRCHDEGVPRGLVGDDECCALRLRV